MDSAMLPPLTPVLQHRPVQQRHEGRSRRCSAWPDDRRRSGQQHGRTKRRTRCRTASRADSYRAVARLTRARQPHLARLPRPSLYSNPADHSRTADSEEMIQCNKPSCSSAVRVSGLARRKSRLALGALLFIAPESRAVSRLFRLSDCLRALHLFVQLESHWAGEMGRSKELCQFLQQRSDTETPVEFDLFRRRRDGSLDSSRLCSPRSCSTRSSSGDMSGGASTSCRW